MHTTLNLQWEMIHNYGTDSYTDMFVIFSDELPRYPSSFHDIFSSQATQDLEHITSPARKTYASY